MQEKVFREDLYYRLTIFPITVPPLRERGGDVVRLTFHFLKMLGSRLTVPIPPLKEKHVSDLKQYKWPGNVRELENTVERALILSIPSIHKSEIHNIPPQ